MGIIGKLWDHMKAKRRGERRVAPYAQRGRVYERPDGKQAGQHNVRPEPVVTVGIQVTRADGTVEDLGTVPGRIQPKQ